MNNSNILIAVCAIVFLISLPYCWDYIGEAGTYWLGSDELAVPFYDVGSVRNLLTAIALTSAAIMTPIGLLAFAVQQMTGGETINKVLSILTTSALLIFVVCQLILYNTWGGTGRHLGQTSLAIYSGTANCFVSLFVMYRFWEARRADSEYAPLFEKQLAIMCAGPVLYRAAYGLWFLILGHEFDGIWTQQSVLTLGYFLIPLLAIYVGSHIHRSRGLLPGIALVYSGIAIALIVLGLVGYHGSSVRPALV